MFTKKSVDSKVSSRDQVPLCCVRLFWTLCTWALTTRRNTLWLIQATFKKAWKCNSSLAPSLVSLFHSPPVLRITLKPISWHSDLMNQQALTTQGTAAYLTARGRCINGKEYEAFIKGSFRSGPGLRHTWQFSSWYGRPWGPSLASGICERLLIIIIDPIFYRLECCNLSYFNWQKSK